MAEDERTIDVPAERSDEHDRSPTESIDDSENPRLSESDDEPVAHATGMVVDDIAERFHELDADLDRSAGGTSAEPRRAIVTDAERVDAEAVPETYPLADDSDEAIALTLDFGTETATAYLAWPSDAGETGLTRLLDVLDIELRDLYGEAVLAEQHGKRAVLLTPAEAPRGTDHRGGILGGLAGVGAFVGLLGLAPGVATLVAPLWGLVTLGILPYVVYKDAWYVRTHSDWDGGPAFWATLAALPFLNLGTVGAYLWRRSKATFYDDRRSVTDSILPRVRSLL